MNNIRGNKWFFVPTLLFFCIGGVLVAIVPYSHEILFFNQYRREPFNTLFQILTYCGEVWAFVFFGSILLFRRPRFAVLIGIAGILAMPISYWAKDQIGVDRPITFFEKRGQHTDQPVLVPDVRLNRGQTSFPSGHSMAAFALYSLLAMMLPVRQKHWGLPMAIIAVLVGISRIFLVQHFLADVLGGALLGLALSLGVWILYHQYARPVRA